jgi:hypothetical protein
MDEIWMTEMKEIWHDSQIYIEQKYNSFSKAVKRVLEAGSQSPVYLHVDQQFNTTTIPLTIPMVFAPVHTYWSLNPSESWEL